MLAWTGRRSHRKCITEGGLKAGFLSRRTDTGRVGETVKNGAQGGDPISCEGNHGSTPELCMMGLTLNSIAKAVRTKKREPLPKFQKGH